MATRFVQSTSSNAGTFFRLNYQNVPFQLIFFTPVFFHIHSIQTTNTNFEHLGQVDAASSQINKEFVQINQQFSDLNLQYQPQLTTPLAVPLNYGVNSYGSAPQSLAEPQSFQNNYGESDTLVEAHEQQPHVEHYEDQQSIQYQPNYYQSGSNNSQHNAEQQTHIFQPQSIDSNSSLSYGDANYMNSEVNFHIFLFSFALVSQMHFIQEYLP